MKGDTKPTRSKTLISISKKTFIQVTVLLVCLMVVSIILTYILPKGEFGTLTDGSPDYSTYTKSSDQSGVNIFKGIFAPFLVFASGDGLTLIMLSLFLLIISAAFQVMNDSGGIRLIVGAVSKRFEKRRNLLIAIVALVFMLFGAFLGLFEEMLTMLPIVAALCLMIGLDSFTGFLISIVACGFGFASAVTNPFTVLLASEIIGVNPLTHIYYRLIIFAVMYLLLLGFIFLYVRKISKKPESSLTLQHDGELRASISAGNAPGFESVVTLDESGSGENTGARSARKVKITYIIFLLVSLGLIILCSSLSALRDYTVPVLIAYFLIFGIIAGIIATSKPKEVFKSFGKGIVGALPTLVFIGLAASVKYIFDEGRVMPTIVNQINELTAGRSPIMVALFVYLIILLLEFFISSSTAKAILVMGILSVVSVGLSKSMMVLLYTFADGYTNVIFPTSPVLLISLSMIGVDYFKWVKKSAPLFLVNLALVAGFILLGLAIGY
ncbi:MAG: hypothetical protein J5950_07355 [Clostridia bacterium]|nr:hypothetical protein [Clostridia bacterium]